MPGIYQPGDYDLAGFVVGVVERDQIIDGSSIAVGHRLIGLASSGLHANGYSWSARSSWSATACDLEDEIPELGGPLERNSSNPPASTWRQCSTCCGIFPLERHLSRYRRRLDR